MSEENQTPEEEKPPVWEERKFLVRNATRSRNNRTLRAQQPKHHGLKQFLAGGKYRIIRGRPVTLTESEIMAVMPELREKVLSGALEICTPDGRLIDIDTGREMASTPPPPLPNPPMDSIANDKQNVGQRMPQFPGGTTETDPEGDIPALVAKAGGEDAPTQAPPPPPPPVEEQKTAAPSVAETSKDEVPGLLGGGGSEETEEVDVEDDDMFGEEDDK